METYYSKTARPWSGGRRRRFHRAEVFFSNFFYLETLAPEFVRKGT